MLETDMSYPVEAVNFAKTAVLITGQLRVAADIAAWLSRDRPNGKATRGTIDDDGTALLELEFAVDEERIKKLESERDDAEWLFLQYFCVDQRLSATAIWKLPPEERRNIINVGLNACLAQSA